MNKITTKLKKIQASDKIGLMTHIVLGYPNFKRNLDMLRSMENAGVDFIEMQIPFSDPIADGETIMMANQFALDSGITVKDCFDFFQKASQTINTPLLIMTYYNIIQKYGVNKFLSDAKSAGISGLIVPDLPRSEERYEQFFSTCKANNLIPISFISPATTKKRIETIDKAAKGFIYAFSNFGITGKSLLVSDHIQNYLKSLKSSLSHPIAVGFGISTREHIHKIEKYADIAIVGSAIIRKIEGIKANEIPKIVEKFIRELRS